MTFIRAAFLCVFLLLIGAIFAVRSLVAPYFSTALGGNEPRIAAAPPATSTPPRPRRRPTTIPATATPRVVIRVVTATPAATATAAATETPLAPAVSRPVVHHLAPQPRHHPSISSKPHPTRIPPTATPRPLPSPTAGTVQLANYWVDSRQARRGQVVAVAYVIDNTTGHVEDISLGASLKARSALSWAAAINDPAHDVVAIVPPGVSTHVRYFTVPRGVHPGAYDVAWGLRNAASGQRVGLVFAPDVLTVTR